MVAGGGTGIGRRWPRWDGHRDGSPTLQVELSDDRQRQLGQLLLAGRAKDVCANVAENIPDLGRLLDVLEECRCVGAVAPGSVGGRSSGLGGVGDDRPDRCFDPGQPALDPYRTRRCDGALEGLRQRVVAACIEHENLQGPRLLKIAEHVVNLRKPVKVLLAVELGIDRHQIIDAVELDGVAAVVEDADVGGLRSARKADDGVLHSGMVEVDPPDNLEIHALERRRHILRVVRRIGQVWRIRVTAIADDERNAFVGPGVRVDDAAKDQPESKTAQPAHVPRPMFITPYRRIAGDLRKFNNQASYFAGRVRRCSPRGPSRLLTTTRDVSGWSMVDGRATGLVNAVDTFINFRRFAFAAGAAKYKLPFVYSERGVCHGWRTDGDWSGPLQGLLRCRRVRGQDFAPRTTCRPAGPFPAGRAPAPCHCASGKRCRFVLTPGLELAPAAGPVIGDDLPEHRTERGCVDPLALADGDRAGGLVVVTPGDDRLGIGDDGAVVEEDVDVVLRGEQGTDVVQQHEIRLAAPLDGLGNLRVGSVDQVTDLPTDVLLPAGQAIDIRVHARV